jgi:hypothetical protein
MHPIRHDRTRVHGALANPGRTTPRDQCHLTLAASHDYRSHDVARLPGLDSSVRRLITGRASRTQVGDWSPRQTRSVAAPITVGADESVDTGRIRDCLVPGCPPGTQGPTITARVARPGMRPPPDLSGSGGKATEGCESSLPRGFDFGGENEVLDVAGRLVHPHVTARIQVGEGNGLGVRVADAEVRRVCAQARQLGQGDGRCHRVQLRVRVCDYVDVDGLLTEVSPADAVLDLDDGARVRRSPQR